MGYVIKMPCIGFPELIECGESGNMSEAVFESLKQEASPRIQFFEDATIYLESGEYILLADEDGKNKRLPINELATAFYNNPYDYICGDVFISRRSTSELTYMTEEDLAIFKEMFSLMGPLKEKRLKILDVYKEV